MRRWSIRNRSVWTVSRAHAENAGFRATWDVRIHLLCLGHHLARHEGGHRHRFPRSLRGPAVEHSGRGPVTNRARERRTRQAAIAVGATFGLRFGVADYVEPDNPTLWPEVHHRRPRRGNQFRIDTHRITRVRRRFRAGGLHATSDWRTGFGCHRGLHPVRTGRVRGDFARFAIGGCPGRHHRLPLLYGGFRDDTADDATLWRGATRWPDRHDRRPHSPLALSPAAAGRLGVDVVPLEMAGVPGVALLVDPGGTDLDDDVFPAGARLGRQQAW